MNENKPPGNQLTNLESTLADLRVGRRLQQVTTSINSFLANQMARLETAIAQCQNAEQQNEVLQRIIAEFEQQKMAWEKTRQAEEKRLFQAGERLIEGWKQLEQERESWQSSSNMVPSTASAMH